MVSVIGRRAPEFERLRELRSALKEYQIEYDRALWLSARIPKIDPRYGKIQNQCINLPIKMSTFRMSIDREIKRLAEKGIFKGAIRSS